MSIRTTNFAEGEFYHIYNRGTDKRPLYQSEGDYQRFMGLMFVSNSSAGVNYREIANSHESVYLYQKEDPLVAIGAYCLMPNHFHILLTPLVDDGVSLFMRKLGTSYSMYFNKKYERTGTLFEGKFKAKHAATDEYLKYLYAYIHLNPAKMAPEPTGLQTADSRLTFLQRYQYSSFPDYIGHERAEQGILNPAPFPDYFISAADHIEELQYWLQTYSP